MERSENFGFYLPSRDSDDTVDISQISDNFRIIDKELPKATQGSGVSSWNDLTDKPFYEEIKTATLDYNNLPNVYIDLGDTKWYKVTDDILTEDDLKGSVLSATVTNSQGEVASDTLTISAFTGINEFEFGNAFIDVICGSVLYWIVVATKAGQFESEGNTLTVPQTGTYFGLMPTGEETLNLMSLEYEYIKPLDIKFIPDALYTEIDQRIEESIGDIETLLGGI